MTDERFTKIDEAIQRLAGVASDLSKMLAVHEHRIGQQEKTSENIVASMERRRSEIDGVLKDLYSTMRSEVNLLRENSTKQHNDQNVKIESIQKAMWMAVGAASLVSWALPIVINKILH